MTPPADEENWLANIKISEKMNSHVTSSHLTRVQWVSGWAAGFCQDGAVSTEQWEVPVVQWSEPLAVSR